MSIQQYEQYNDPLLIVWRTGKTGDEYVPRTDSLQIVNGRIVLSETPSEIHKVQITGYSELSQERYQRINKLESFQFLVNYSNGIVQFNDSEEGKSVVASYMGKGLILIPASKVYSHVKDSPEAVVTLQDVIENTNQKIEEAGIAIDHANQASQQANISAAEAILARDNAILAAELANKATEETIETAETLTITYGEPVDTEEDLIVTYPNPQNGLRVQIKDSGKVFRYDGAFSNEWELIDQLSFENIPLATPMSDGLLSKEDYNRMHDKLHKKTIVFVINSVQEVGIQYTRIQFPSSGQISKIKAFCAENSSFLETIIQVQRISEADFLAENEFLWEYVLESPLVIPFSGRYVESTDIVDEFIDHGDFFRLVIDQYDYALRGLTVQLEILL